MNLGMRVNETMRKRRIWENLQSEIYRLVGVVKTTDKNAKVYLFGSALTGKHNMASDIDILVVTDVPYGEMLFSLTENGFEYPFEIHVRTPKESEIYLSMIHEIKMVS
jgi:predicted nucleotidyltransferase